MRIWFCLATLALICFLALEAAGQSRVSDGRASTQRPSSYEPSLTCLPAPCTLPPTLASEGFGAVVDAPIQANPVKPNQLILGSEDDKCGEFTTLGFHVSNDGATWSTTCMGYLNEFGKMWQPGAEPLVGYDLHGTAYIAGYYQWNYNDIYNSVVGLEKSTDGVTWSEPISALGTGSSMIFYASLAVDQSASSP